MNFCFFLTKIETRGDVGGGGGLCQKILYHNNTIKSSFKNCLSVELIGSGFIEKLISVVD